MRSATLSSEMDIAVPHLDYKEPKKTDEHGNLFKYRAKVSDAKGAGTGHWDWDVFLSTNPHFELGEGL